MSITYATLPSPSVTPGPLWAQELNAMFTGDPGSGAAGLYAHRHEGTDEQKVRPAGMTIDAALAFNANPATGLSYVSLSGVASTTLNSLYALAGDLYFYSGVGSPIKITALTTLNGGGVANGFQGQYQVSGAADYETSNGFSFYNLHSAWSDANLTLGRWGALELKAPGANVTTAPLFLYHEGGATHGGWSQSSPSNTGWQVAFDSTTAGTYADIGLRLLPTNDTSAPHTYTLIQNGLVAGASRAAVLGATYNSTGFKNVLALTVVGQAGVQSTWGAALAFDATNSSSNPNPQAFIKGFWSNSATTLGGLRFDDQAGTAMLTLDRNASLATFAGSITAPTTITAGSQVTTPQITSASGSLSILSANGIVAMPVTVQVGSLVPNATGTIDLGTSGAIWNTVHQDAARFYSSATLKAKVTHEGLTHWAMSHGSTNNTVLQQFSINNSATNTTWTSGQCVITLANNLPANPIILAVQNSASVGASPNSVNAYATSANTIAVTCYNNGAQSPQPFSIMVLGAGL